MISCNKRTSIQAYTIDHAPFPLIRSVRNQNFRKIAAQVESGSTGHIAVPVTTPCHVAGRGGSEGPGLSVTVPYGMQQDKSKGGWAPKFSSMYSISVAINRKRARERKNE